MVPCASCQRELGGSPAASICYEDFGDTWDETWYLCPACDVYTRTVCHEVYLSDDEHTMTSGPIARAEGDARVALIRTCPDPGNKRCRCATHQEHF